MKFKVKVGDLLAAVTVAAKAVSSRTSYLRVLTCIELTAEQKEVRLVGTDMTTTISVSVPLEERSAKGQVLVPAANLADMLKVFERDDEAQFEHVKEGLRMEVGSAQINLETFPTEEFPRLPEIEGEWTTLDATALRSAFDVVEPSASRDESRPVLMGVQIRSAGGKIQLAATDSFRLACSSFEAKGVPEFTYLIRADAVALALRLLGKEDYLRICESRNASGHPMVSFAFGSTVLTTRVIDGKYPDVDKLLPDEFETVITLDRKPFHEACRRLAKFGSGSADTPARLWIGDDSIRTTIKRLDVGDYNDIVGADVAGAAGYEIGFNPKNLLEGVDTVADERLTFKLINPLRPGVLTGGDESTWYLMMPIRLAG